eukprot:Em0005g453a
MQVIRASNTCHGKLWLLKAGNPRRTFPLRSVFSTFPTDRKFEFKLEIKGNRRLSHVFHLLDDNLSLTYAMNHWMAYGTPQLLQDYWMIGTVLIQ